jgi:hypothetical protein
MAPWLYWDCYRNAILRVAITDLTLRLHAMMADPWGVGWLAP